MEEKQQNQLILTNFTADDFFTEKPYKLLYSLQLKRFETRQALIAMKKYAASLGVNQLLVQQLWNDYLADQKPAYTIGSNEVVLFPNIGEVIGEGTVFTSGKYQCDERGVSYVGSMGEWIQVLPHPLLPTKRIVDIETNNENLQISYCRIVSNLEKKEAKAPWKHLITSRETLASAQRIIGLSKNGIAVNSENAKEVVKYIAEIENLNYGVLSTQLACSHMGWLSNGQFAPYTDQVVFGGESEEFARLYSQFKGTGDENKWLEIAKKVRAGKSVPARIALAASFAAPLVQKLGALSFFVHFWGTQGTGKTVALMLGASVWGNPLIGGYVKSFAGTKVSQELYAAFCGNLPVFLDELQVISDRKTFDDIIYALCEGVSKGRGAKEGGLQTQKRWATVFMTTGEMSIVNSNSGGGAAVRTIEVNFGGEPFFDDARTVANTLKENYGWAGEKFIHALAEDGTLDALREIQKKFYADLSGDIQDKQVLSASILLAADALANIAIFNDGKSLTVNEIKPYLITQDQADINRRAYAYFVGWLANNAAHYSDEPNDNKGQQYGIIEYDKKLKRNIAYTTKNTFEKIFRDENYPVSSFYQWAKRNGLLKTRRKDANDIQKTIGKISSWCIAVALPDEKKEDEDEQSEQEHAQNDDVKNGFIQVNEEDELPF